MIDKEILDWIEEHHCEIRYRREALEYLGTGERLKRFWWIAPEGKNPFIGGTLREAVKRCKRFTTNKKKRFEPRGVITGEEEGK